MVAYSFKKRFGEDIISHRKRQTIRGKRRRQAREGEQVQLYTGLRTRYCTLLMRPICIGVDPVDIAMDEDGITAIEVAGVAIEDLDAFARADGFADLADMSRFWLAEHGAKAFCGDLIRWDPATAEPVVEKVGIERECEI